MTTPANYAAAHAAIRISSKRFRFSPFASCYAKPDTLWGVYSGRLYALSWGDDPNVAYNKLRHEAMLYDVPEHPIEFSGPDAMKLCQRLFCRRMDNLAIGRGRYAIACRHDGGILMDGILLRLGEELFWYIMADGEFLPWVYAASDGLNVAIRDPDSSIVQIQGPCAFDVLAALWEPEKARNLPYFHVRELTIAGVPLLISRTGWTGEMGFELYTKGPLADGPALWNHLLDIGRPFGLGASGLDSMGVRRIEAGILDNGTDMDPSLTPYQAGLGAFVDLGAEGFIGRKALAAADQRSLLLGLKATSGVPLAGMAILDGGKKVGRIAAGGFSPTLKQGIGYARFHEVGAWLGKSVHYEDKSGTKHGAEIVALPFFDAEKRIPRGLPL